MRSGRIREESRRWRGGCLGGGREAALCTIGWFNYLYKRLGMCCTCIECADRRGGCVGICRLYISRLYRMTIPSILTAI